MPSTHTAAAAGATAAAPPTRVFKLATAAEAAGFREGGKVLSSLDKADGFVHLSDSSSAPVVAKLFFAGAEDLVLLEIDPAAFVSPTWIVGKMGDAAPDADTVAASPTTVHYMLPDGCVHVYGTTGVTTEMVVREAPVPLGEGGVHVFPDWLPGSAAEADEYDVVVYGAGPVGAAVALGLQQRGHRVCVREKRSEQQVIGDAGKSINLSLSTRGRALLVEIGVYPDLESSLVPMVCRRFPDGSFEKYREPLQSINRNVLTIKIIEAAQKAGVRFDYDVGYAREDFDAATGEIKLGDRTIKPRIIVGCDGVHGKVSKLINPAEAPRSSRASEWGYYELNLSAEATKDMAEEDFKHFHIWSGKGQYSDEFIVGLPNADKSITLTLFAPMDKMVGRYTVDNDGANKLRQYLGEAYDDNLDTRADGLEDAVAGNFWSIWLNDHECLAKEVDDTGTFVFLFGDAALGMEQFLGLAVNLGFEGVHRVLEHYSREGPRDVDFYRGLARARNVHNAGAKALQQASSKNAASMRDGCDEPLGKAVREALEAAHGKADINESGFESTHDWWSYCEIPLKVCEAIVDDQDAVVADIKQAVLDGRAGNADAGAKLSEAEMQTVLQMAAPRIGPMLAQRAQRIEAHHANVAKCF